MIVQNDMKIAFASFEQPPQKDHRRNLTRWFAQRKDQAVQGLSTSQKTELTELILNEKIVFIVKEEDITVSGLKSELINQDLKMFSYALCSFKV